MPKRQPVEAPPRERLIEIARRIEAQPWNRPGTNKAWVLHVLRQHQRFTQQVRRARRVEPA